MGSKCDKGWKDGSCCCNCISQHKLSKHPWNSGEAKGSTDEIAGYACIVKLDSESEERSTFFDQPHGFCELHVPTPEREKYLNLRKASVKFGLEKPQPDTAIDRDEIVNRWKDAGMIITPTSWIIIDPDKINSLL